MITDEQKIELYKYWKDPIYAMESIFRIQTPQGEVIPFRLTDNQKMLLVGMEYHRFNVVKKSRQLGSDTIFAALIAYKCVLNYEPSNPEVYLYQTHMGEMSYEFIRKVRYFANQIPEWAWNFFDDERRFYRTDTKKELVFFNGCRIRSFCTSRDAIRGFTPSHLIMDSASFYGKDGTEMFGAALTALGTGGQATVISVPNGMDSFFEPLYTKALNMTNNFNSINMHWAYDYRFNKDMVWSKLDETVPEIEYTRKSIAEKLIYGWKPVSRWSDEMTQSMFREGGSDYYINQELHGEFV